MTSSGGPGGVETLRPHDSLSVASLEAKSPVDGLDEDEDDWLPADQPADPVQQLTVHHVRLLPGVWEHSLEIDLFVTVGTGLLLANDAPAANAELMELVTTGKTKCVLNDSLLICCDQQLVAAN